jgi:aspartyl-tRNA synthetase
MNFPVADKVKKVCGHSLILRGSPGRKLVLAIDSVLMTSRTRISDLPATTDGSTVVVGGFVETVRDQKKVQFIILRDETGSVQLVNPALRAEDEDAAAQPDRRELTDSISALTGGTFVLAEGALKLDERVKLGGLEVKIASLELAGVAEQEPPIAEDSSVDKRMDWRFLDLRRPEANLIFRAQTAFEHGMRGWWVGNDWIEIHTPKLMASASESRAELFEVEYFDTTAYLAQSPQLFKQMAQPAGFGAVFEIAPAFRADPSFTARHATEFTSVDAEMSWVESHHDVMAMHESVLRAGLAEVSARYGDAITQQLEVDISIPDAEFPKVTLAQAREIVSNTGYEIPRADGDLDPEAERRLCAHIEETTGHPFVFVTDYDSSIRPFYHMRHDDNPALTKSYDLLYRGTEISTGAQREHRIDVLVAQATERGMDLEELGTYLDFFRHGVPPHGGFGMGLARVMMLMLNQSSIRETTFLFRGPNRLTP